MKSFIRNRLLKIIQNSDGKPYRVRKILEHYSNRALKRGVRPEFITAGKQLVRTQGLQDGLDFISIMTRLEGGDYSVVHIIVERFMSKDRFDVLVNTYPDIIENEIKVTGDSTLVKWLADNELLDVEDPILKNYVTDRIDWALEVRKKEAVAPQPSLDRSRALSVLSQLKSIFDKAGHRFFLSSGTLLGAYREQGFIAGDTDIDLGVLEAEVDIKTCSKLFKGSGFALHEVTSDYMKIVHKATRVSVDVYAYKRDGDYMVFGDRINSWIHTPFDLGVFDFQGHEFFVPDNVEIHLTERYGNWQDHVLYFDPIFDGPNHIYKNTVDSVLYLAGRTSRSFTKGSRYFADQGAYGLRDFFNIDYTRYIPQAKNKYAIPFPFEAEDVKGKKVVAVFGIFDGLNLQSVRKLKSAMKRGESVIVGVYSDDFLLEFEGIIPETGQTERVNVVRAVSGIDNVRLIQSQKEIDLMLTTFEPVEVMENTKLSTIQAKVSSPATT